MLDERSPVEAVVDPAQEPGWAATCLAVAFGGALGALLRAGAAEVLGAGPGLWAVNVLGAAAAGWWAARGGAMGSRALAQAFVLTGVLGGFTTVSGWVAAVAAGGRAQALALAAGMPLVVVGATALGARLAGNGAPGAGSGAGPGARAGDAGGRAEGAA